MHQAKTDSQKRVGFAVARQRLHHPSGFCDQISSPGHSIPGIQLRFSRPINAINFQSKAGRTSAVKVTYPSIINTTIYSQNLSILKETPAYPPSMIILSY